MALAHGDVPVGAVVVHDGKIIASRHNEREKCGDPTAHAEVVAIRRACAALGTFSLAGATIYASCEPCPMCLSAIYWARIDRIVFASTRDEAAAIGFDDARIYDEIAKPVGARAIPTVHHARADADALFAAWLAKPDRVPY